MGGENEQHGSYTLWDKCYLNPDGAAKYNTNMRSLARGQVCCVYGLGFLCCVFFPL